MNVVTKWDVVDGEILGAYIVCPTCEGAGLVESGTLDLPEGASPLTVQMQDDDVPRMWVRVDDENPLVRHQFFVERLRRLQLMELHAQLQRHGEHGARRDRL